MSMFNINNPVMYPNEAPLHEDKYYLMRDVDRHDCEAYDNIDDAREAIDEAYDEGYENLWIGRGEAIDHGFGEQIEIVFCEGESE